MNLLPCLSALLLSMACCGVSAAADAAVSDGRDGEAVPPDWKQMYSEQHILAEIDQVTGADMPLRIFCLKCDAAGRPDQNPFVRGEKMMVRCVIWGQLAGRWRRMISLCLICPQEELHYESFCIDGDLHVRAKGFDWEDGGDIAAWKTKGEEARFGLRDYLRILPEEKEK